MDARWVEMRLSGLEVSQAEALGQFPKLQAALSEIGLIQPTLSWSEKHQRIVLTFQEMENSDDLLDDETDQLVWDILESVFPDAPIFNQPEPEEFEDDVIGTFYWDEEFENWAADYELSEDEAIEIRLDPQGGEVGPLMSRARSFVADLPGGDLHVRRTAAESKLLDLYNSHWNDGDAISCDAFIEQLGLVSVEYEPSRTSFTYDDGDLFGMHAVVIDMDAQGQFKDASLEG